MSRVSKDPEERKTEIVDAAEELFITKGYDKTAVSDIVKKVGVAQGLFYYYFKCKEEILNAIAAKYLNSIVKRIKKITENTQYDALEKTHLIIEDVLDALGVRKKGIMKLARHVHREENIAMHQKVALKLVEQVTPQISGVVKQGVQEGVFDTQYPDEATRILLTWAALLHNNLEFPIEDIEGMENSARAIEDFVERVLGAKKGSMQFVKYARWLSNV